MKKTLLVGAARTLLFLAYICELNISDVSAQGTVRFYNRVTEAGLDAPVLIVSRESCCIKLSGPDAFAQIYYQGEAVGIPAPFRSGAGSGYFTAGIVQIPGAPAGSVVTLDIKIWLRAASYEAAVMKGALGPVTVVLGGSGTPPSAPAVLSGLMSRTFSWDLGWGLGWKPWIIHRHPQNRVVKPGQPVSFSVDVDPGTEPVCHFGWEKLADNMVWQPVASANARSDELKFGSGMVRCNLVFSGTDWQDAGLYRLALHCGGWSDTAVLRIIDPPSVSIVTAATPAGTLGLSVTVPTDLKLGLESSSDLRSWTEITSPNLDPATGILLVPVAPNQPKRFYRIVVGL